MSLPPIIRLIDSFLRLVVTFVIGILCIIIVFFTAPFVALSTFNIEKRKIRLDHFKKGLISFLENLNLETRK